MRGNDPKYQPVLVTRAETNKIDATMVNLGGRTVLFNDEDLNASVYSATMDSFYCRGQNKSSMV